MGPAWARQRRQRFADEGAQVALGDINEAAAQKVADSLPDTVAVLVDVSNATSVQRAIAAWIRSTAGLLGQGAEKRIPMSDSLVRHEDAVRTLKADEPRRVRSGQRVDLQDLIAKAHDGPVEAGPLLEDMDLASADHSDLLWFHHRPLTVDEWLPPPRRLQMSS